MSGHSKWSKVKHQKATTDAVKASEFTRASHAISVAVSEGGGGTDPEHNFRLRLAIEKARMVNMPKENIQRAIEKGKGQEGNGLEQIIYEGYGPGGVGFMIDVATTNRNRAVSEIKNVLERGGGTLVNPGGVAYLFRAKVTIPVSMSTRQQIRELVNNLESLADVQKVLTNETV